LELLLGILFIRINIGGGMIVGRIKIDNCRIENMGE
jgi:hypothetical protein